MKLIGLLVTTFFTVALGVGGLSAEPLRVGILKIAALTTAVVAKERDIFKRNGLEVELGELRGGSDLISALQGGAFDIVQVIPGTAIPAIENGFDLTAIFQNEVAKNAGPDSGSVQVKVDSPIKEMKDLAGKKVGILQLHNQQTAGVIRILRRAGVNPSSVQFVELPFPAHYEALKNNQVEAVATVDPFTTQMLVTGLGRVISWSYVESVPEQPLGVWWVKRSFLEKNKATVEKFNASLKESIDYLNADAERARAHVASYTGLNAALVKDMPILKWSYEVNPTKWQEIIDLMRETGVIRRAHKAEDLFSDAIKPYISARR